MGEDALEQPAPQPVPRLSRHLLLHQVAADVDKAPVFDSRGACRLARAAGDAAVQVQLRARGDRRALEHLLHEVDATARAVELVAQQVVGGTGREAEAAMHALAQDRVGLDSLRRVLDPVGEPSLHQPKALMPSPVMARATAGRSVMRRKNGSMFFMRTAGGSRNRPQRVMTMK